MSKINFITEDQARDLIESEVEANTDFIQEGKGFIQHCLDTGRIGYEVSTKIIENHPSLRDLIKPELIRVQGYMHDFSKIYEGSKYHEVGTAHIVLTQGDNLGLLNGGTQNERRKLLREMASMIPPDYALFEELGGNDFPGGALYPDVIDSFMERVMQLRTDLSESEQPLTMEEFALPRTLNQQIAMYADLTNVNGERVSVEQRMEDIQQRYSTAPYSNPTFAQVTDVIRPRVLVVANTIENLLRQSP